MATWADKYREGSFRNVKFYTKAHEYNAGRRDVKHEFPNREKGNTEDLGKKLPGFNLEIYVLGDDYFDARDKLLDALDKEGPGELVHPYLGKKNVQVGEYSLSETTEETRLARFKVNFTLAGSADLPAETVDPFQAALNAINGVLDAAQAGLEAGFNVINYPARVALLAGKGVQAAADRLTAVSRLMSGTAAGIADAAYVIRNTKATALDLVKTPSALAEQFKSAFSLLIDAAEDFATLTSIFSNQTSSFETEEVVGGDTETTAQMVRNGAAFSGFISQVSIATQAQAAIEATYKSAQEAARVRAQLNADIETQLPLIGDDETFQKVKDLQAAVNLALPPPNVGDVVTFTLPKTLPVLVIANRLFGDIDKEAEIISQNKVRHPGFVPGLSTIEVTNG